MLARYRRSWKLFQENPGHPVMPASPALSRSDSRKFDLAQVSTCKGAIDIITCWEKNQRLAPRDVKADEHLYVYGWSVATNPLAIFDRYFFVIDGHRMFPVDYGMTRPDVAKAHRNQTILKCGFSATFSVAMLEPGEHELTFVGLSGDRLQSFAPATPFRVLAAPVLVSTAAPTTELRGRVRTLRETQIDLRHDGRADRAIRHRASLLLNGWVAASPIGAAADDIAVLLSGHGRVYRISAQRRSEPEAGVALGTGAEACGYQTCAASDDFLPGIYNIGIEVSIGGTHRTVLTNDWVEIMCRVNSWLPSALPMYHTPFAGDLLSTLPDRVTRSDDLFILGWTQRPESISGVYARIDGEATYALTSGIAKGNPSIGEDATGDGFGGILAVRLRTGPHEIEILALDATHTGMWSVQRHAFEVVTEPLH